MYIERQIEKEINKWLYEHEIILILGSRRVGKTTLLKKILFQKNDMQKHYVDFEDTNIREIANEGVENFINFLALNGIDIKKNVLIGLDEIQKLKDPSNLLKIIHDHYPKIKLIVTGSSSLDIKKKFTDSLAGRKVTFYLYPFNFKEFLKAKNETLCEIYNNLPKLTDILSDSVNVKLFDKLYKKFQPFLNEYLVFGGYPDIVFSDSIDKKSKRLHDIITSHIEKDIKDISNINNIEGFNRILIAIAANVNNVINKSNLSRIARANIHTVEHYISLLKKIYILNEISPYYKNKETEIVKQTKIYFSDNGTRNKILNNMSLMEMRIDIGALYEMFAMNHLKQIKDIKINFWRTKSGAGVDFIVTINSNIIPIEIKSSDIKIGNISKSTRNFIMKYKPEKVVIINKNRAGIYAYNKCKIYYLPLFLIK